MNNQKGTNITSKPAAEPRMNFRSSILQTDRQSIPALGKQTRELGGRGISPVLVLESAPKAEMARNYQNAPSPSQHRARALLMGAEEGVEGASSLGLLPHLAARSAAPREAITPPPALRHPPRAAATESEVGRAHGREGRRRGAGGVNCLAAFSYALSLGRPQSPMASQGKFVSVNLNKSYGQPASSSSSSGAPSNPFGNAPPARAGGGGVGGGGMVVLSRPRSASSAGQTTPGISPVLISASLSSVPSSFPTVRGDAGEI
ncbi:hypothetical protein Taro_022472 [Colocasia esculenta]|uniref:Uncharacterized protein n=1 Tax=Colocasia esculenta TaxID=4460 RepID=A0A843V813_COLES|nr:hypothetical protein [Colocasia esculenta]